MISSRQRHRTLLLTGLCGFLGACGPESPQPAERPAASTATAVVERLEAARVQATKVNLQRIANGLVMYATKHGSFPQDLATLETQRFLQPGKLSDPWKTPFRYRPPAKRMGEFELCSAGPDRRFGTGDDVCSDVR